MPVVLEMRSLILEVSFTDTQVQQDSTSNSNRWWDSNSWSDINFDHINLALGNTFQLSGTTVGCQARGAGK